MFLGAAQLQPPTVRRPLPGRHAHQQERSGWNLSDQFAAFVPKLRRDCLSASPLELHLQMGSKTREVQLCDQQLIH